MYTQFLHEYGTVRAHQGWGHPTADYYRNLPHVPPSDPQAAIWRIRVNSYQTLLQQVILPWEKKASHPLKILDLGAGNSWLSNRLAERHHHCAALDLSLSDKDGLGAWVHYPNAFTSIQAEFDHLPFQDQQADLLIFNGSFHYATDYLPTLHEALRVLQPTGSLIILDTPVYHTQASGEKMVKEREDQFQQRYGFPSNALPTENFLTYEKLKRLGEATGLTWHFIRPAYGVAWEMRYWKARLLGHREPAQFMIICGKK